MTDIGISMAGLYIKSQRTYIPLQNVYYYVLLLPNALSKSILRTFDCCLIILLLQGKQATEKSVYNSKVCWPVNRALLTGHMTNDVMKSQMSRRQLEHWLTIDSVLVI